MFKMSLLSFFIKGIEVFDTSTCFYFLNMIWMNIFLLGTVFNFTNLDFKLGYFFNINDLSFLHITSNIYLFVVFLSLSLLVAFILVFKEVKKGNNELELQSILLKEIGDKDLSKKLIIRNKVYMSKENERALLDVIVSYEKSLFFLKKDISLTQLAFDSGIDEKYISYIIKKHRGKDFITYVNDLRIFYIVECLKENPIYLEYKISYLASQSGFTSHSCFSITFKKVVGVSPSGFISNLKNN